LAAPLLSCSSPLVGLCSDEDAEAEYAAPANKARKSRGGAAADDEEAEAEAGEEEEEEAAGGRKKAAKRRPRAAAAAAAAPSDASVATSKRSVRRGGDAAADAAVDEAELPNPIYRQLAHTATTPTVLAQEVVKQYADPRRRAKATIALVNFMLQVGAHDQQRTTATDRTTHSDGGMWVEWRPFGSQSSLCTAAVPLISAAVCVCSSRVAVLAL